MSNRVTRDGVRVGWLYRDAPINDQDSGWLVFAGDEPQDYSPADCVLKPLRELILADSTLEPVFDHPAPCAFERRTPDSEFVPAPHPKG